MFLARAPLIALGAALVAASALTLGASAAPSWPTCMGQPATIVGTDGNDTIQGTHGDDVIAALGGDDLISSGGSNDTDLICAGDGNDSIIVTTGGEGLFALDAAQVSGDAGDDRIQGAKGTFVDADYTGSPDPVAANLGTGQEIGWGNDVLVSVTIVDGSPLDDTLIGSSRVDGLYGEAGNDTISGLAGSDWLGGGPGDDTLDGGPVGTGPTTSTPLPA